MRRGFVWTGAYRPHRHMGGFYMAVQGTSADPAVIGMGLISAADLGARLPNPMPKDKESEAIQGLSKGYASQGMAPLAGCTPESLAKETIANAARWSFPSKIAAIKTRQGISSLRLTTVSLPQTRRSAKAATRVTSLPAPTDHSYSNKRTEAVYTAVLQMAGDHEIDQE